MPIFFSFASAIASGENPAKFVLAAADRFPDVAERIGDHASRQLRPLDGSLGWPPLDVESVLAVAFRARAVLNPLAILSLASRISDVFLSRVGDEVFAIGDCGAFRSRRRPEEAEVSPEVGRFAALLRNVVALRL
jgi:hypothetical protein